jgi:RNA recognition motif-containing protein
MINIEVKYKLKKGYCFVRFFSEEDMKKALLLNDVEYLGSYNI